VLDYFSSHLKDLSSYRVMQGRVCFYGWSTNEHFVVKATPRTALVSGCSGHMFKFGALIGLEIARLVDGVLPPNEFTHWLSGKVLSGNQPIR
jgi:glycine/D-amino acid oxidase-like deaminating enzyme